MIKEVYTWGQVVVEINRIIRSGRPACLRIKGDSVVVSDYTIEECKYGIVITREVTIQGLRSNILDYLSRMYFIRNNRSVQDVLDMLAIIGQGGGWKQYDTI